MHSRHGFCVFRHSYLYCTVSLMDKIEALRLATLWTKHTWMRLDKMYPGQLGTMPTVEISNRMKTTAGYCYWERRHTKYSLELLSQYPEEFRLETIPHELAHQVNWDLFRPAGNGCHDANWKQIMINLGLQPNRCHDMINVLHAARRAKVKL